MEGDLKVGRYRVEKRIGDPSGMGIVYKGYDTQTDSPVVLKFIKPEYLNDPQFRRRMALEARAAANLSHPCIAKALAFYDDGKECFIVYEFVEGETLRQILSKKSFTAGEILDVGIKVADALEFAHAKGFLHRDLKPANIMQTPRPGQFGWVKVLDFGLAKQVRAIDQAQSATLGTDPAGRITTELSLIGTLEYMAPEQVGMEDADQRTDLYTLGLILYELATHVNPFQAVERRDLVTNILTREAPPVTGQNPSIPREFDHIIQKCLRKKRDERFQTAKDLLVELEKARYYLPDGPDPKPKPPPPLPPPITPIPPTLARALFVVIQLGYLALYVATAVYLPRHIDRIYELFGLKEIALVIPFLAMTGAALRLYFAAAVTIDYSDTGRLFDRLFPFIAILDELWAMAPLLIFQEIQWLSLLCIVGLAILPFSQRTLLYTAYAPRGGKTSGVGAATPA